jgi:hypothetical protein
VDEDAGLAREGQRCADGLLGSAAEGEHVADGLDVADRGLGGLDRLAERGLLGPASLRTPATVVTST